MTRIPKLVLFAALAVFLAPARPARAADSRGTDSLDVVLHKLDLAAARFHTTSADFVFTSIQTDPIPDTDTQKGSVYYERKGNSFQMAAHIREINGRDLPKIYEYAGGVFELYEPVLNQVTRFARAGKFESYVMLGFGASGKDLADKWNIKLAGTETIDGVLTDKLELIAKDPAVRKNLPKVTIWIDPERGVSLKQVFDEAGGAQRTCTYSHIRVNDSLPRDAFSFKTNKDTQYVNH
ncbi:MAG TPA: outer membrane lipoprotein-sorting protein [Terracidiphilus sp.]|nr:outer membrane lipoprotein-sorting protein [Terracidiphilus sp.]